MRRPWSPDTQQHEHGAIAVFVAILVPLFLVLAGVSVDVGRWYLEVQRVQNAADAAAMAGVTWLPQNPTKAFSTAKTNAALNGYGASAVTTLVGGKASQLYVSVTATVPNAFGSFFGRPTTTITRAAMADYAAPAIMGSPCNALGNQPPSSAAGAQPVGTVIPTGTLPLGTTTPGYEACQLTPAFWMNIAGPTSDKQSGDRYATQTNCSSGVDFCTGGTNIEYDKNGYIYVVRVQPEVIAADASVTLQLYDPAFIYTDDACNAAPAPSTITATVSKKARASNVATITTTANHGFNTGDTVTVALSGADATFNGTFVVTVPSATTFTYANVGTATGSTNNGGTATHEVSMINPFAPTSTDVAARYAKDSNTNAAAKIYCPGDQRFTTGAAHLNTSIVLRHQTDSLDPYDSTKSPAIATCAKQYSSLRSGSGASDGEVAPTAAQLTATDSKYDASLAQMFHQWVTFCTFKPDKPGDYYLQIRTNVRLVGTPQGNSFEYVVNDGHQLTDPSSGSLDEGSSAGSGHNRFAIRAVLPSPALGAKVSVAGYQQMSIYTNAASASSKFNLVQVLPNSAGNSFNFEAYDNGDADCPVTGDCTITVSLPVDATSTDGNPLTLSNCTSTRSGSAVSPYANPCSFAVSSTTNQGKVQVITVPIPTNYTCQGDSPGGCWFQVTAKFKTTVSDTTTWGTEIIEDPVRLIQ